MQVNFFRLDAFLNFVVKLPWSCFIRNQYAGGRFYGKENESAFSGSFCRPRIVLGGGALISPQTTFAAEVTISDPSDARLNQAELAGGASTGPGDNTPIVGNVLTFKNVSFMGTGYYTGIGYGGRNFAGTVVERNRIHVDGAQVKIAIGGRGLNGAVRDNTALVYNLSKVQTAKGGEARGSGQENTASGNHLGVVSSVVQSGYGGLSSYGTAEKNTVEISGGAFMQNVYGGSGDFGSPLATIRENSVTIENATFQDLGVQFPWSGDHTKEIAGGVVQSTVGGIGSTISENSVTIKSGTISVPVYGGKSYNGATVTKNKVVLTGGTYTDLIYGGDAHTEASENEVHLTNVTVPAVFGGSAAIANNNKIYLNGGVTVAQSIVGGDGTTSTGNTLTVKGVNTVQDRIKEVQKYAFDIAGVASTANPLLTVGGAVQTDMDWTQLSVTGTPAASLLNQTITLMRQSGSDIAFGLTYNGKKVATDDGVEHIVDTDTQAPTDMRLRLQATHSRGRQLRRRSAQTLGADAPSAATPRVRIRLSSRAARIRMSTAAGRQARARLRKTRTRATRISSRSRAARRSRAMSTAGLRQTVQRTTIRCILTARPPAGLSSADAAARRRTTPSS